MPIFFSMTNNTAKFWEVVDANGTQLDTFTQLQFQAAMGFASRQRATGVSCDVRKIVPR